MGYLLSGLDGGGYLPSQVWVGGTYLLAGGGVPTLRSEWGGTYLPRSGWGGTYSGLDGGYLPR